MDAETFSTVDRLHGFSESFLQTGVALDPGALLPDRVVEGGSRRPPAWRRRADLPHVRLHSCLDGRTGPTADMESAMPEAAVAETVSVPRLRRPAPPTPHHEPAERIATTMTDGLSPSPSIEDRDWTSDSYPTRHTRGQIRPSRDADIDSVAASEAGRSPRVTGRGGRGPAFPPPGTSAIRIPVDSLETESDRAETPGPSVMNRCPC